MAWGICPSCLPVFIYVYGGGGCSWRPEEDTGSPGAGVTSDWIPTWVLGTELHLLEGHHLLRTAVLSAKDFPLPNLYVLYSETLAIFSVTLQ